MTDVEILAQLLRNATAGDGTADWSGYVAEYLLAHGVSVSEPRLPSWVYPLWDAALNVAPEGPWRAHKAAIEDWWEVERDGGAEYFGPRLFATKVEAIAVRDALNRVASQGEKPQ